MNITQNTRLQVQFEANTILNAYRPNDKTTFKPFPERNLVDRQFIKELSDILGYNAHEKKNEEFVNKFIHIFLLANDLFTQYNKPIRSQADLLRIYDACIESALTTDYVHYAEYAGKLKKWYRTYRGMAKLASYKGDLRHEDLLKRTKYMIRADQFTDFINDPANCIGDNRQDLINGHKEQIGTILQHA